MPSTDYIAIQARNHNWRRQAVRLSRSHIPFRLADFNARHDGNFYFALKKKFDLEARIDFDTGEVYFSPKNAR